VTDDDRPPDVDEWGREAVGPGVPGDRASRTAAGTADGSAARLASEAPLAKAAVVAALGGIVFGITFLPQLFGLALGGLSLVRREPGGRRPALLAVALSLVLTVGWAVVLGLIITWWASTRV
jgi:hypothetical protein